ncbi:MAG: zf-HC2 domain-containing protein [Chloroflexia bacterium]
MKHEDWRLLVSAYCDGEVTPEERAQVEAHLAECAECARALEAYRRLGRAIRALPQGTPSRTLWARVQEGLARPARPLWWRLLPVASAAAMLLAAVVVALLLRPIPSGPAVPQAPETQRERGGAPEVGSPAPKSLPLFFPAPAPPTATEGYLTSGFAPCPGIPLALEVVAVSVRSEAELPSPRLRGLLYDEAGRPLPGVTLVFSGTAGWQGSTTTASDGTFSLPLPAAGTYRVVVALTPELKAAAASREGREPYRLILPDGSVCQTWQVEIFPPLTVGPQQEISLTLRVRP